MVSCENTQHKTIPENKDLPFNINHNLLNKTPSKNTTQLPILFSAIPGFGRAYYGHKFDGFVSFIYVSGFSYLSYNTFKKKNEIMGIFSGIVVLLFWSADIFATNQLSFD